ncbi:MAG: cation transporter [Bacilli bacterium]|nr:cation transporter [Bacilli bacterium]
MNRFKRAKRASIIGIIGNIFLLIIKATIGFISNSQAMIADAFNSFGDVFSSFMTYIGNRISSKAADEDHNLGHGKAEYIFSLLISIVMFLTSITVVKKAIITYIDKIPISFNYYLIIVCIITIIVKFSLFLYTNSIYKKDKNILIKANSKDHRNDCFITILTLISTILGLYGYYIIDILIGITIAIWIGYTSIKLFIESYDVLMDKSIDDSTKEEVLEIIKRHEEVIRVNHFNSTPVGYKYQISFTIFVDGNLSTFESHEIANSLEREIAKEIEEIYLTVIHVNPIKIKEKK